jgi:hypothetical protein
MNDALKVVHTGEDASLFIDLLDGFFVCSKSVFSYSFVPMWLFSIMYDENCKYGDHRS